MSPRLQSAPPGVHAFHIHTTGRCEAPDFESAGGHFAPAGRHHGFLAPGGAHASDLPNARVPAGGKVPVEAIAPGIVLAPAPHLRDFLAPCLVVPGCRGPGTVGGCLRAIAGAGRDRREQSDEHRHVEFSSLSSS